MVPGTKITSQVISLRITAAAGLSTALRNRPCGILQGWGGGFQSGEKSQSITVPSAALSSESSLSRAPCRCN